MKRLSTLLHFSAVLAIALSFSGCAVEGDRSPESQVDTQSLVKGSIAGTAFGGQQPVAQAAVYLYATGTTGYGGSSTSLINSSTANSVRDSNGNYYVRTDSAGNYSIPSFTACTPGSALYLYALGGVNGSSGTAANPAIGMFAGAGICSASGTQPSGGPTSIVINEVTTAAMAYALAGFTTTATQISSSGTTQAQAGLANAMGTALNLANVQYGTANVSYPTSSISIVPQAELNTLGDILAACINSFNSASTASSGCTTLLNNSTADGTTTGTKPTETATAIINIAHHPGANIAALYALANGTAPFQPTLSAQPNDFTVAVKFRDPNNIANPNAVAIDAAGTAWVTSYGIGGNSNNALQGLVQITPAGVVTNHGGAGASIENSNQIAINTDGNIWVSNGNLRTMIIYNSSGTSASNSDGTYIIGQSNYGNGYPNGVAGDGTGQMWTGTTYGNPSYIYGYSSGGSVVNYGGSLSSGNGTKGVAVDSAQNIWVTGYSANTIIKYTQSGGQTGTYSGGGLNAPRNIAVNRSGDIWVANNGGSSLTVFNASGTFLSGTSGYTGGGLSNPFQVAVDGDNTMWAANYGNNSVSAFTATGSAISPSAGYTAAMTQPRGLAIDPSGDIWVIESTDPNNSYGDAVTEFIGAAAPVVTPIAVGVKNSTLGRRP